MAIPMTRVGGGRGARGRRRGISLAPRAEAFLDSDSGVRAVFSRIRKKKLDIELSFV